MHPRKRLAMLCLALAAILSGGVLAAEAPGAGAYREALIAFQGGDREAARAGFEAAWEAGDPRAALALGKMLWAGFGGPAEPERGCDLMAAAAEAGAAPAEYGYGLCFSYGRGRPRNLDEAVVWQERAVADGVVRAFCNLAIHLQTGRGVVQDAGRARRLCREAVERGDSEAPASLGMIYLMEQDFDAAAPWLLQAAEAGNADAAFNYGLMHLKGDGVPEDREAAEAWLLRAAEAGNREAAFTLGELHSGSFVTWETAFWFSVAADTHPDRSLRGRAQAFAKAAQNSLGAEAQARVEEKLARYRAEGLGPYRPEAEDLWRRISADGD